jgi:hypothetical protein
MQFDLNCVIIQQFTNIFVSFSVTTDTAIIAIVITLIFIVIVTDHEILTPVHFIGNSRNFETFSTISEEMNAMLRGSIHTLSEMVCASFYR